METIKTKLTKTVIEKLEPQGKSYRVWDTSEQGFYVRVTPNGAKSFVIRYRNGGRNLDFTIGKFPTMTEPMARRKAIKHRAQATEGTDLLAASKENAAKAKADRLAAKLARKHERENAERAKHETLGGFIDHKYTPWAEANLRGHAEQLRVLAVDFKAMHTLPLPSVTQWTVQKWAAEKRKSGLRASSVNRRITALKSVLTKATEWGVIESSPLRGMKRIKTDDAPKPRFLSGDEEKQLRATLEARQARQRLERDQYNAWRAARHLAPLQALADTYTDHIYPIVIVAMNTGMRRGELFNLEWKDVDLSGRLLTVQGGGAKSGRTRHIPLNDDAFATLVVWRNQSDDEPARVFPSPVTGERLDNVKSAWGNVIKDAGIKAFRFHDLRHTFASNLVMRGADLTTVRELLGHADIETTMRYAHLTPEHKAATVALLCKPTAIAAVK
ncbi:MAG: site-specific integrase [Gammaproteobacteria bacterium]|nr:site-specific integrase [Gammaproteobacteria bacterium]MBP6053664.1 site-specific integrase [Pseudomonadales bacterium]